MSILFLKDMSNMQVPEGTITNKNMLYTNFFMEETKQ